MDRIINILQVVTKIIGFVIVEVVPFGRAIKDLFKKKPTNLK